MLHFGRSFPLLPHPRLLLSVWSVLFPPLRRVRHFARSESETQFWVKPVCHGPLMMFTSPPLQPLPATAAYWPMGQPIKQGSAAQPAAPIYCPKRMRSVGHQLVGLTVLLCFSCIIIFFYNNINCLC